MALTSQPMFQREMQRAHSKASMRGQRPKTAALQSRLAEMDMARKLAFGEIYNTKARSDLQQAGRKADLGMRRDALAKKKAALPWQIGIGVGTGLMGAYEGKRRADMIKEATRKSDERFAITQRQNKEKTNAMKTAYGLWPSQLGMAPQE